MHLRPLLTKCNPFANFATPVKGVYYNCITYCIGIINLLTLEYKIQTS